MTLLAEEEIRPVAQEELAEALDLVNRVFAVYVAPDYSEKGQKTFQDYLKTKYDEVAGELARGQKEMWQIKGGTPRRIIGVIALREKSHIALLFVDPKFHRQGVASRLFCYVKEIIQEAGGKRITVNSSPYAQEVYHRWGFQDTGKERENEGIRYIPMALDLEAKKT